MLNLIKSLKNIKKVYFDYSTAFQNSDPGAYQADEIIDVVYKKTINFKKKLENNHFISSNIANSICGFVPCIIDKNSTEIRVMDFGGACGALYFQMRKYFPQNLKIQWAVVETPAMVKKAKNLESEELKFYDSIEDAVNQLINIDVLHTSATLQALENPREYLLKLLNLKSKYIFFNRVGVHKGEKDLYTVHRSKLSWNGPGDLPEGYLDKWVKYPYGFMSEAFFLQSIQNQYDIIAKFQDYSGMYPIWGYKIDGYALLCKLK